MNEIHHTSNPKKVSRTHILPVLLLASALTTALYSAPANAALQQLIIA